MSKSTTAKPAAAYVAVVGVSYIPQGGTKEKRVQPGEPVEKCPAAILERYLERGKVKAAPAAKQVNGSEPA